MTSCALSTNTEQIIQHGKNCSSQGCENFGLTKKTNVMYQPAPGKPYQEPHITVKGQNLQAVDNFTYQGSALSRVVHIDIDAEVNNRIAKANVAFGTLRENVWERIAISLFTKLKQFTVQWYSSLFSTHVRPGLCTADTYTPTSLKIST